MPRPLTWDLSTVLRSAELKPFSLKTALLLALGSVKRVGYLQALSVSASCLEFGPGL